MCAYCSTEEPHSLQELQGLIKTAHIRKQPFSDSMYGLAHVLMEALVGSALPGTFLGLNKS